MDPLSYLKKSAIINKIINLTHKKGRKVFLVGGLLRDIFIGKESFDFDFAVDKQAINLGRFIADSFRGDFVVLDKEHGSARVLVVYKGQAYTLDFTDFRGSDIKGDLFKRDFTINALALDISSLKKAQKISDILIDPCGGRCDIKNALIRVINSGTFSDDPLRILRVFSLSAILNFKIDDYTLALAKKEKIGLMSVSAERIREELFKVLKTARAKEFFRFMDECVVLTEIIPQIELMRNIEQGPYHHLDVLSHSFETMAQIEKLFYELRRNKKIASYLNEIIGAEHSRRQVLKLAAFLHDIGKPGALTLENDRTRFHGHEHIGKRLCSLICDRLKMSAREKEAIKVMVLWHLRPGYLADNPEVTDRAIFRYFRDTGDEGVSILLLSMADQRATRGPKTSAQSRLQHEKVCLWLMKEYFRRKEEKKLPHLISGDDLIKKLKLVPGPIFREILEAIEEEQAAGEIKTKKEALEFAKKRAKSFQR